MGASAARGVGVAGDRAKGIVQIGMVGDEQVRARAMAGVARCGERRRCPLTSPIEGGEFDILAFKP